MKHLKSARQVQRFLSAHDHFNNLFHLHRDHLPAAEYRAVRAQTFAIWAAVTGAEVAAKAVTPISDAPLSLPAST